MTAPKSPGRPPLGPASRAVPVCVRMTRTEYDAAYARAQRDGVSVPDVLRTALNHALRDPDEED